MNMHSPKNYQSVWRESSIDKDDELRNVLENALSALETLQSLITEDQRNAKASKDLRPEDGVIESYDRALAATTEAHDSIN